MTDELAVQLEPTLSLYWRGSGPSLRQSNDCAAVKAYRLICTIGAFASKKMLVDYRHRCG